MKNFQLLLTLIRIEAGAKEREVGFLLSSSLFHSFSLDAGLGKDLFNHWVQDINAPFQVYDSGDHK